MSTDSEMDAQMSPKEVADAQKCEASEFRATWAKQGLMSRQDSEEICDHCITFQGLAMRNGGTGDLPFRCQYPGGKFSAELSCTKCIGQKKLCGSQAIRAAHKKWAEKEKERRKKKRDALKAEKQRILKEQEAKRAERKRQKLENQVEMLQATAREQLKRDRRFRGLHLELTLLSHAHREWEITESEKRREPEYRWKRRQEEQRQRQLLRQQLELLGALNELTRVYMEGLAACE